MCGSFKSGSLTRSITWSSEIKGVSAPMFVQSTLECDQGGYHDNVLGELIPDVCIAVIKTVCATIHSALIFPLTVLWPRVRL